MSKQLTNIHHPNRKPLDHQPDKCMSDLIHRRLLQKASTPRIAQELDINALLAVEKLTIFSENVERKNEHSADYRDELLTKILSNCEIVLEEVSATTCSQSNTSQSLIECLMRRHDTYSPEQESRFSPTIFAASTWGPGEPFNTLPVGEYPWRS